MSASTPTRCRRLLAAWALAAAVAGLAAPVRAETGLREVLERVWERAVQARVAEARQAEADAGRVGAESLIAGAPVLGLSQRDDRLNRNRGLREQELGISVPLWLPGQRSAQRALAARDAEDGEATITATRLALAGELRNAAWAYAGARAEAELARERLALAEQLEAGVARREAAGDLARTDLLLAREDTLAARGALAAALGRERQAQERYRLLTGLEELPARMEETAAPATTMAALDAAAPHPRVRLAEAAAERARAGLRVARESRRDAPELSLGVQQSREDFASAGRNTLRLGLSIPFATEGRNAPRIAAANSALIRAEAESRQVLAEVAAAQREALAMLDNAELADAAARERSALAAERLRLLLRAFELGELSLAELMRARGGANAARLEAVQARIALAAARANMNQAKGLLP